MPISTITAIQPNGQFESQHGPMFKFIVTFADGAKGHVNAKTEQPPHRVGEERAYTQTGEFGGLPRFKLEKLGLPMNPAHVQQTISGYTQQVSHPPQALQQQFQPNVPAISPINGPTAGMAIKTALEILTQGLTHEAIVQQVVSPSFWQATYETACDVVRVMQKIEHGDLAKPVTQRGAQRPQAGPGGSVAMGNTDEDVSF